MKSIENQQFLNEETKKLNEYFFGSFSYESSLKKKLNQDSLYTPGILKFARSIDNRIQKNSFSSKPKTLQKKKTLLK